MMGHHLKPGVVVALAESLYGHRPEAFLLSVLGNDFDFGEALSPQTSHPCRAGDRSPAATGRCTRVDARAGALIHALICYSDSGRQDRRTGNMPDVHVTIDGTEVSVPSNSTVLEAAKIAGIDIPTLCDHPAIEPIGACRMCLVEIEKQRVLQPACTFPVFEGMVVHTALREGRRRAQVCAAAALFRAQPLLHVLPDERKLRAARPGLRLWAGSLAVPAAYPQVLMWMPRASSL